MRSLPSAATQPLPPLTGWAGLAHIPPCAHSQAHEHKRELYPHAARDPEVLTWHKRWGLIQQEVQHFRPDVLCLQVRGAQR